MRFDELHPYEKWLVNKWRNEYKYGKLTIIIQDGIPQRIEFGVVQEQPCDKSQTIKDTPNYE